MEIPTDQVEALIKAIETDFCEWEAGQRFGERLLELFDPLPIWVLDLYNATDKEEVLGALWASDWGGTKANYLFQVTSPISYYLGFLYLCYQRGDLTIEVLLERAGREADALGHNGIHCEDFYLLLSERDGRGSFHIIPEPATFDHRVLALFEPHVSLVQPHLAWLTNL